MKLLIFLGKKFEKFFKNKNSKYFVYLTFVYFIYKYLEISSHLHFDYIIIMITPL